MESEHRMKKISICLVIIFAITLLPACIGDMNMKKYYMPSEETLHEGTYLTWVHEYTYGKKYREEIENVWIEMTKALHAGENVHIIAYNEFEKERIIGLLNKERIDLSKIDFVIAKSDDVWTRDSGPIFVYDEDNKVVIADFGFDGWGQKAPYKKDDKLPKAVAEQKGIPIVDISDFVLEGGAIEIDGNGTLMATLSCVNSDSRNKKLSLEEVENYLKQYLGVSNFIWLEGVEGEDITDAHIDGIARFYDKNTLLTVSENDFFELYEGILESDYDILCNAKNTEGIKYDIIELPLTSKNVIGLDYKGSYLNYYVANEVVLVPIYNDKNDKIAIDVIQRLYKSKKIVPIDVSVLYKNGGMIHCITQQQPKQNN